MKPYFGLVIQVYKCPKVTPKALTKIAKCAKRWDLYYEWRNGYRDVLWSKSY